MSSRVFDIRKGILTSLLSLVFSHRNIMDLDKITDNVDSTGGHTFFEQLSPNLVATRYSIQCVLLIHTGTEVPRADGVPSKTILALRLLKLYCDRNYDEVMSATTSKLLKVALVKTKERLDKLHYYLVALDDDGTYPELHNVSHTASERIDELINNENRPHVETKALFAQYISDYNSQTIARYNNIVMVGGKKTVKRK